MLSTIVHIKYNIVMNVTNAESQVICQDFLNLLTKFKTFVVQIADEYGLTMVQTHALYVLHERGSLPMGRVADELHCDPSNVTGIIDRLVNHRLVARIEDPNDRRTKRLVLSDKGADLVEKIFARLPAELGFTALDEEEQRCLKSITRKLLV